MRIAWVFVAAGCLVGDACVPVLDRCGRASPGESRECPLEGVFDRGFSIRVPGAWDGVRALPVVFAFHGGGGNRQSAERVTCPDGEAGGAQCLAATANRAGYVVVLPDGTGTRPTRNVRTWNAGGDAAGWDCVSGGACAAEVDDVAFFDTLLAEVERVVPIDRKRVFLTGLSNGAAMAHRLACERADIVAAIAAFGGTNQFAIAGGRCDVSVPVLQVHGTDDPCWTYVTSSEACATLQPGKKLGVAESNEAWRLRNGCAVDFVDTGLPDRANDGTRVTRRSWSGCAAALEHLRIEGGGHTWPGGYQYLDEDVIGRVSHDIDGNAEILRFFDAHPKP